MVGESSTTKILFVLVLSDTFQKTHFNRGLQIRGSYLGGRYCTRTYEITKAGLLWFNILLMSKLIGIISDTHGLVRPQAIEALDGVELILHAGDVGNQQVLDHLNAIAPVVAVRGNNDKGEWAHALPDWEVVEVGKVSIYILHDIKEIDISPSGAGFRVVVSGHSHKPSIEEHRGVLYINPGSAGPRRFTLPVSLAHVQVAGEKVHANIVELTV